MSIKAFIFDLDGTLIDTLKDLAISVNFSLKLNGFKTHEIDEYRHFLGNGSKVLISKAIGEKVDDKISEKVYQDYMNYYLNNVAVYSTPYEGILEVIKYIKNNNMLLCCLTNKPDTAAKELISKVFGDCFDCIIGNSKTFPTKPNPAGLNYILEKYNLLPCEVCYLGDSDVDIILAKNAKIEKNVACCYGYRPREELEKCHPYALIDKPLDILHLDFVN